MLVILFFGILAVATFWVMPFAAVTFVLNGVLFSRLHESGLSNADAAQILIWSVTFAFAIDVLRGLRRRKPAIVRARR